jgi:hypothetical protein
MKNSFSKDAKEFGHSLVSEETEEEVVENNKNEEEVYKNMGKFDINQIRYDGYEYMQKSECDYDHIRIVTMIFKRNIDNNH